MLALRSRWLWSLEILASAAVLVGVVIGAGCTVDFGGAQGSGSGGASTASMGTAGTTSGTQTTTGMGGAPGTTSSDAASSGQTTVGSSVSSSTGTMTANLPFCTGVGSSDDFEGYMGSDTVFTTVGEGVMGPWEEFEQSGHIDKVELEPDGNQFVIKTRMDGGTPGMLYRRKAFTVTADCAITAELKSLNDKLAGLRLSQDPANLSANAATVEFDHDSNELRPYGQAGTVVQLPVMIAIVVTAAAPQHVHAFYYDNGTSKWKSLLSSAQGQQMDWLAGASVRAGFGHVDDNGNESRWDNFNVMPVPVCALAGNCP